MSTTFSLPTTCAVPTAATGTNTAQVASRAFVVATYPLARRITTLEATGYLTASDATGTYLLPNGQHAVQLGTNGSAYTIPFEYYDSSLDATILDKAPRRYLSVTYSVNDVAPVCTFDVKLFSVQPPSAPATSGGAGEVRYAVSGTIVDSVCTITTPAADSFATVISEDFHSAMATGTYAIGIVLSGTLPLACHVQFNAIMYTAHV